MFFVVEVLKIYEWNWEFEIDIFINFYDNVVISIRRIKYYGFRVIYYMIRYILFVIVVVKI